VNLGYHRPLAEKAIAKVLQTAVEPAFGPVLKQVLRELAK
jgi:hypothetical protein